MTDRDFDPVVDAFKASLAARVWNAIGGRVRRDWQTSAIARAIQLKLAPIRPATPEHQVRFAALAMAIAAIAHLAIRLWLPRYATSGFPWWWNAVVAVFAIMVALCSPAIVASWPASAPARAWRRIGG